MNGNKQFYLSAYTPDGMKSFFENVFTPFSDDRLFLVTGGCGKMRSDFIRNTAKIISKEGFRCETLLSNQDENVDAVFFDEIGVSIIDAASSKISDCKLCDCTQYIINLGEICDRAELYERRDEIFSLQREIDSHMQKCKKFLSAAVSMQEDTQRIVGKSLNAEKLEKFVTRFIKKEFGTVSDDTGKLSKRFLSTLSPGGVKTEYETVKKMCARVYVLDDAFSIVCDTLINQIAKAALACGYDVILCPDIIDVSKTRHVIIPQLSLCFFTSDLLCGWDDEYFKKINFTRFVDRETVKSHRNRIKFNNDAIEELVCQSCVNLEMAKCGIDRLDDIYSGCSDLEKAEIYVEKTVDEILHPLKADI